MTEDQKAAVDEIKRVIAETGFTLLGGSESAGVEKFSWRAEDISPEEEDAIARYKDFVAEEPDSRPCGRESGPCCGGRCG